MPTDILAIAATNLLSPVVLFFALGALASLARSDLEIPDAVAKGLALYLMLAIGFKGGAELARYGLDPTLLVTMVLAVILSAGLPLVAFALLRVMSPLGRVDAAAVAAHYGSISVVTFVAAAEFVTANGLGYAGWMVAVLALMETPAIVTALTLAGGGGDRRSAMPNRMRAALFREVLLNGSVVLLLGAFVIGWITGPEGLDALAPFVVDPFQGMLCLFLLDMGLVAARGLRRSLGSLTRGTIAFGIVMPLTGAVSGFAAAWLAGLDHGSAALLVTLAASASYIAVPAALRIAMPEANAAIYVTLSLGITFPFNLTIGIPLYVGVASLIG